MDPERPLIKVLLMAASGRLASFMSVVNNGLCLA
jgi:hypothetical protein